MLRLVRGVRPQHFIVKKVITMAMDRKTRECEMAARLLSGVSLPRGDVILIEQSIPNVCTPCARLGLKDMRNT